MAEALLVGMLKHDFQGPTYPIEHSNNYLMLSVPSRCTIITIFPTCTDVLLITKIQVCILKLQFHLKFFSFFYFPKH